MSLGVSSSGSISSSSLSAAASGWGAALRRHWPFTGVVGVEASSSGSNGSGRRAAAAAREGGRGAALAAAAATTATLLTTSGGGSSSEMQGHSSSSSGHTGGPGSGEGRTEPYKVVFVLGGPGAGKGTQCERLVQRYGFVHLSVRLGFRYNGAVLFPHDPPSHPTNHPTNETQAGELLRQERAKGSEDGKLIDEYLVQGKIVPVRISLGLLRREMAASKANRFLVDGFPRNFDNVQVRACAHTCVR